MTEDSSVPPIPPVPPPPSASPYAPVSPASPAPSPANPYAATAYPAGYGAPQPAGTGRRTWDVVLTIVLLVLGLIGMLFGLLMAAVLPMSLADSGGFVDDALVAGDQAVIVISHLVLFLAAVGISIPLLVTRRIAFWVPLTAGVIAAIVFWATLVGAMIASGAV